LGGGGKPIKAPTVLFCHFDLVSPQFVTADDV
jgi:hypothetical protein